MRFSRPVSIIAALAVALAALVCATGCERTRAASITLHAADGGVIQRWDGVSRVEMERNDPWVTFRAKDKTFYSLHGTVVVQWDEK